MYKWRKYVHGVANPRIEDGYRKKKKKERVGVRFRAAVPEAGG